MTGTRARWLPAEQPTGAIRALAKELDVPAWFAGLLALRGVSSAADARRYLQPSMADLHDPFLMLGMERAVHRILTAIRSREPILIYGDYDVDGTIATVLLKTAIDRLTPMDLSSLVRYHIPHRIREGYGMQTSVLGTAATDGIRLVISVDTGIRAFAAANEARALGLDLIVTDHHLPDGAGLPDAYAVVHPNQEGCAYPCKELCGAGVACKLAEALLREAAKLPAEGAVGLRAVSAEALDGKLMPSFLKLLAIATVADAVPLMGENRTIAALGIAALRQPRQHGLRALMELAGVPVNGDGAPTAQDIAFRVAPRINAAGRMEIADDVVRMLLTSNMEEGRELAEKLHRLNEERRGVEAAVLAEAKLQIAPWMLGSKQVKEPACLVLDGREWHRGVVGIVASRIVETTGLPALVIARDGEEAHGSGRSIAGFHLLDALTSVHQEAGGALFHRFGGHAHAVGFSLASEQIPALRESLSRYAQGRISAGMVERTLQLDADLPLDQVTPEVVRLVQSLEPFGQGNREPVFYSRVVEVCDAPRLLKDTHLKLRLRAGSRSSGIACLCWSRAVPWPKRFEELGIIQGAVVDVAYRLRENTYADIGTPELELCDIRISNDSSQL